MGILVRMVESMARPYVAGPRLDDAMRMAELARARGSAVTLCYWHDERDPAEKLHAAYGALIAAVSRAGLDAHMSMKVPGFAGDTGLIAAVMAEARRLGVAVDIDAHGPEQVQTDYAVAEALGPAGLGIAIPGRWAQAPELADRAVGIGLRVRVVKGQWPDPETPELDPAAGFLAVIDRLAGRAREVGVATHDAALAREAIRRLIAAGTPVEQELLYGLPMSPAVEIGRAAGVPTRVYIPFGTAWLPYSIKKALRTPGTLPRIVGDIVHNRRDGLPPPR